MTGALVAEILGRRLWDELQSGVWGPCFCDAKGIGIPGVSCGDCPFRDYKDAHGVSASADQEP